MAMDYLQPLLVLSAIVQQMVAGLLPPDPDGLYPMERLKDVLDEDTMQFAPLLQKLRVGLKGVGATVLTGFSLLPAKELERLLVRLCASLVAAVGLRYKGLVVFVDDLHLCDGGR